MAKSKGTKATKATKIAGKTKTRPVKKSTPVTVAAPPPPPAPPPERDEMIAPRDVARLLRYGEKFGPHKIDVRMLPVQLPSGTGALAVFDPGAPKSWHVFDRPAGTGAFRVMLSVAQKDGRDQLAAVVIHVGRPPIAKWTVAHYRGSKKPRAADQLPRCAITTGWLALLDAGDGAPGVIAMPVAGTITPIECPLTDGRRALALPCGSGEYAAYWAVDAADKPICLVVEFDVFTQKEWKARAT